MQIKQTPVFAPITLVLETAEEAYAVWDAMLLAQHAPPGATMVPDRLSFYINLSNAFSNDMQLGGKTK